MTSPPPKSGDTFAGPGIDYWLDPVPDGQASEVALRLGDPDDYDSEVYLAVDQRLRALRPAAADWVYTTFSRGVLPVFGSHPAAELVYSWLWDDLAQVQWVTGTLGPGL